MSPAVAARAVAIACAVLAAGTVAAAGSFSQGVTWQVVPVGLGVGLVCTALVVVAAGTLAGTRWAAAAAALGWLAVVLLLSLPRAEGDVVLPAEPTAYAWLYGGAALAGMCLALDYGRLHRRLLDRLQTEG